MNVLPELGVAVSVTVVPELNDALQVLPQFIPEGLEVMVPLPELNTSRVYVEGANWVNRAEALL